VRALEGHPTSVAVQEYGCRALLSLSVNDENKVAIAKVRGIQAVVRGMARHQASAAVQDSGCSVLSNLGLNGDNKVKIAQAGGIQAVIRATEAHPTSAAVQERAVKALIHLGVFGDATYDDESCIGLCELVWTTSPGRETDTAIQAVVRAMEGHLTSAAVQGYGCQALSNLGVNEEDTVLITQADRIQVVVRAMQEHWTSAELQKYCCQALRNLGVHGDNHPH